MIGAQSPRGRDRGLSATVETALIVPMLVLVVGLIVGAGRVWHARGVVADVAAAAARSASLERSGASAAAQARAMASAGLSAGGVRCAATDVQVDTSAFAVPVGNPGTVSVTIACHVEMGDILVPGWPGRMEVVRTSTSTLDRFRERRP